MQLVLEHALAAELHPPAARTAAALALARGGLGWLGLGLGFGLGLGLELGSGLGLGLGLGLGSGLGLELGIGPVAVEARPVGIRRALVPVLTNLNREAGGLQACGLPDLGVEAGDLRARS